MAVLLEGRIQRYPWGSTTLLQDLCGLPNDGQPIAELWFGTHPKAPSIVAGTTQNLSELLERDPGLSFLLKLIAVARPLSIQAHPNAEAAKLGFDREEKQGISLSAFERSYPDPNHKPELLVALSEFHALAGFDAPQQISDALALIHSSELHALVTPLRVADDLHRSFSALLHSDAKVQGAILEALRRAHPMGNPKLVLAQRLLSEYPNDLGALLSVFLRTLVLQPGQALYVTSGLLHCYLSGLAVEIMANSDNVLRCGLTTKHVDVEELLRLVDAATAPLVLQPAATLGSAEASYQASVPEFLLSRLALSTGQPISVNALRAELVLAVGSTVALADGDGTTVIKPGQAAFVAPGTSYTVQGTGQCFRAQAAAPGATIRPAAMN